MQKHKHYSRAPITEALIDLKVESSLPEDDLLRSLKSIHSEISEQFREVVDVKNIRNVFQAGSEGTSTATSEKNVGYRFVSNDKRYIIQAYTYGFTFNRLAPYESWDVLLVEAKKAWKAYKAAAKPTRITRVAVRYINSINLPLPSLTFQDYLRTYPEVSPDMSQEVSGYVMQLQLPQHDLSATLVLNQAILQPSEKELPVLLDIDLYREADFSIDQEEEVWKLLDSFRVRKNQVFEACITDKTRELIK